MPLLEVCTDSTAGLEAAITGGADRIELCQALSVGGLTPSRGMMLAATRAPVPVHALIRPRGGDFCYGSAEIAAMIDDIRAAREAGLAGVVIGALTEQGGLDLPALARLADSAGGLSLTLSRAFDLVPDRDAALEAAIDVGFARILTSGGAPTAADALPEIGRLIGMAAGRILILPGGGISAANAGRFLDAGATELHASCSRPGAPARKLTDFGFVRANDRQTDAQLVRRLKAAMIPA